MGSPIVKDLTVHTKDDQQVTVVVEVRAHLDRHYGADADGNRGSREWLIDDVIFEVPSADDFGDILSQDSQNEVEKLVHEKVEDTSWNFDDQD